MNDTVTFFRNLEQDKGMTGQLTVALADELHSLQFYSRLPFNDSRLLSEQKFSDPAAYQNYKSRLYHAISQSGGGLIADTLDRGGQPSMEIYPVASANAEIYYPPRHIIYLQPGYPPTDRALDSKRLELQLRPGSHILLPVDEASENYFRSFHKEYLRWFSPDFGSLVLDIIRQPSLDLRLAHLERNLEAEKAVRLRSREAEVSQAREQLSSLKRLIVASLLLTAGIGLVLAVALGIGFYGYNALKMAIADSRPAVSAGPAAPATPPTPPAQ